MRFGMSACVAAAALVAAGLTTALALGPGAAAADSSTYDVVVYGATPSGVMAAVQATRQGRTVVIVEPGRWIGGMVTGGLAHTDIGSVPGVIGGLPREYFRRVAARYGKTDLWDTEPKVARAVMTQMLTEAGVVVRTGEPLLRTVGGVAKDGARIMAITTTTGDVFTGAEFIDATYEGDLMAAAGVSYTVGRESSRQYGESLAGVRPFSAISRPAMAAYDAEGNLYPEIDPTPLAAVGSADNHVQSYSYRVTSTNRATNRIPYPRPAGYDAHRFAALGAWLPRLQSFLGRPLGVKDVLTMTALPNAKYDTNNNGPFSIDQLNGSVDYVGATDEQRAAIADRTKAYDQGLLYFLQNDPSVPTSLHTALAKYGLAKDEYVDNGNWPTQLYVREARRMLGSYVLRQKDLQTTGARTDAVTFGSYRADEHSNFRGVDASGAVRTEGGFSLTTKLPYRIPYAVIVPRAGEASNLLVTGALSTTHVAWSSIRMEPQLMMLGQAAGDAAALAIAGNTSVQDVPVSALQDQLRQQTVVLQWPTPTPTPTPSPTPTPTPSPTPTPTDTPTPTPTPTDTLTPTPTDTPTPPDPSTVTPTAATPETPAPTGTPTDSGSEGPDPTIRYRSPDAGATR